MKPVTFSVASSMIRIRLGRAPKYIVALPPVMVSAGAADNANRAAPTNAKAQVAKMIQRFFMALWEDQINFAPVFLSRSAFAGPVGRVIQLVGHLRRPE